MTAKQTVEFNRLQARAWRARMRSNALLHRAWTMAGRWGASATTLSDARFNREEADRWDGWAKE
jgi:hypothetical protein